MAKKKKRGGLVLGLDGGGTKTLAAVADLEGNVLGIGRSFGGNFQGVGRKAATLELKKAIDGALADASANPRDISAAGYGIAGADRKKDFDTVAEILSKVDPSGNFVLCNDTTLVLRAGTTDGVGVATVSGTGSNTMGFNAAGDHVKVGGLGDFSGDYGSSSDLVKSAVVASMKSRDGRGPKTILTGMLCEALGLEEIGDIIELTFFDNYQHLSLNRFAPLVFEAARRKDRVAISILSQAGRLVGRDVLSCMKRLFPDRNARVPLVLGGSVYQKGTHPAMIDSLEKTVRRGYPNVILKRLSDEPCVGGVLLALDNALGKPTPQTRHRRLSRSFARKMKEMGTARELG